MPNVRTCRPLDRVTEDWTATPRRLGCGYALLPRQRGTRITDKPSRVPACGNGHGPALSLGTLYDLSEHLGGRRVRGLIGPARVEPPVAALQTTLVPRRHQLYPMRAPQRCAHAHARLRTVSQHLSRAPVFARTSSLASPHRHRARYGASQTTTCSQDDARGGRCLWFWRLRRRAIRSREDQKARSGEVEEKARGGEGCEGGEGWRVAQSAAVQCEEVRRWRG